MSMPLNQLAPVGDVGTILPEDNKYVVSLKSREKGGIGLNDASQGINVYGWTATADKDTGKVFLTKDGTRDILFGTFGPLRTISISFDQNMQPALAYVQEDRVCKLYWYDSTIPGYTTLTMPAGARDPILTMDEKRDPLVSISDILLFYCIGQNLYYRQQRERFTVERLIYTGVQGRLFKIGMNTHWCIQIEFTDDYPDDY